MVQIVSIPNYRWQQFPSRLRRLPGSLEDVELMVFEPAIGPFAWGERKWRNPREGRRLDKRVTLFTLPCSVSVTEDYETRAPGECKRIGGFIRSAIAQYGWEEPLLWCSSPVCAGFYQDIPHSGLVYDCDRSWAGLAPDEWEAALCDGADIVFAASPLLEGQLSPACHNLALVPNGFDEALFAQGIGSSLRTPHDLADIPHPIFGMLGGCGREVNLAPLIYAAKAQPDWSFVLVGEVSRYNPDCNAVAQLPNVHVLGEKSYVSQPHYLGHFDVCLSLSGSDGSESVLPEAFYACLQTGKPIVTLTARPELDQYTDVVYPTHFDIEFLDACRRALAETGEMLPRTRKAHAEEASWSARIAQCQRILHGTALL
ncbi:MAG: hypothetical protein LUG45_06325 [Clostridiales bacterium]|nr:hypothetical protein [Clostridiales bacterium]